MIHIHNGFLIVSATNSFQDIDNNNLVARSILKGNDVPFREVIGCYKGKTEIFFVIGAEFETLVSHFATLFEQESYLKVQGDNFAELVFSKDKVEGLGYFQERRVK